MEPVYKVVLAGRKGTGKTNIFTELQRQRGSDTQMRNNSRRERGIWTAVMNSHGVPVTVRQLLTGLVRSRLGCGSAGYAGFLRFGVCQDSYHNL